MMLRDLASHGGRKSHVDPPEFITVVARAITAEGSAFSANPANAPIRKAIEPDLRMFDV